MVAKRKKPTKRHNGTRGQDGDGRWIYVKWITDPKTGEKKPPPPGKKAWRIWIPSDRDRDRSGPE